MVGGTVYGYDEMRSWVEEQGCTFVLAVPETHAVWVAGQPKPVGLVVAALLPADAWTVLSAGEGSQGPRLYEWAWLELSVEREEGFRLFATRNEVPLEGACALHSRKHLLPPAGRLR